MKPSDMPNIGDTDWIEAEFDIPEDALQLNFCFGNKQMDLWDNNEGENFLMNIEDPAIRKPIPQAEKDALDAQALEVDPLSRSGLCSTCLEITWPTGTGRMIRNRLLHIGFLIFESSGFIPRRFLLGHL